MCVYISLQVVLQVMLNSSSAGSFAGELDKWHKYFQTIEEVLEVWLEVQDLWFELEEVGVAGIKLLTAWQYNPTLFKYELLCVLVQYYWGVLVEMRQYMTYQYVTFISQYS